MRLMFLLFKGSGAKSRAPLIMLNEFVSVDVGTSGDRRSSNGTVNTWIAGVAPVGSTYFGRNHC